MLERGFERAQQLRENRNTVRLLAIALSKGILQTAGVVDSKLEGDSSRTVRVEAQPKIDLREQTYKLLSQVREPSVDEKEALEKIGIKFFPVTSKSYAQVVAEDPARFRDKELDYANATPELRDYALPVAVQIGLRPSELALPSSFDKSRKVQLRMIKDYSKELQAQFPDARAIMFPSVGYALLDKAYEAETGEVLFREYYARALDNLSKARAADAGRGGPSDRFNVHESGIHLGRRHAGAVPVVVFIGNK